jgi:hypothetical protein
MDLQKTQQSNFVQQHELGNSCSFLQRIIHKLPSLLPESSMQIIQDSGKLLL